MRFYSLLTVGILSLGLFGGSSLGAGEHSGSSQLQTKRYCKCDRCQMRRCERIHRQGDQGRHEERRCDCDHNCRDVNCHRDCRGPCFQEVLAQLINKDKLVPLFCAYAPVPFPIALPLGELFPSIPPMAFELVDEGHALKVCEGGLYRIDFSASFLANLLSCSPCDRGIGALKVDLWINCTPVHTFIFPPLGDYPIAGFPCDEACKAFALGGSRECIVCIPPGAKLQLKVAELPNGICQQQQIISLKLGNPCYEGDALRLVLERIGDHPRPHTPPCGPCTSPLPPPPPPPDEV